MSYLTDNFENIDCDEFGNVYRCGKPIKPVHSNGYLQVLLRDKNNKRRICGVHCVVAMKYLNYSDGCIVHHKDKNRQNNELNNLEVHSRKYHCHLHGIENEFFKNLNKGKHSWNYGITMSEEFHEHCRIAAKLRAEKRKNKAL